MGILLCFDMSDIHTYNQLENWLQQIENHASSDVIKFLVATKSDLKAEISYEEARETAERLVIPLFQTSAKTGANVDFVFESICEEILKNLNSPQSSKMKIQVQDKKKVIRIRRKAKMSSKGSHLGEKRKCCQN